MSAAYMREYRKLRPEYAAKNDSDVKALRIKKITFIHEYKERLGCLDCGEKDWIVLELDHRDRYEKLYQPSNLHHRSWEAIHTELAKCDVRCANCHRRRSYKEKHWMPKVAGATV